MVKFYGALKAYVLMWQTALPSHFFLLSKPMAKSHISGRGKYTPFTGWEQQTFLT